MVQKKLMSGKFSRISILQIAITLLTVITAGIHLYLGFRVGIGSGMSGGPGGGGTPPSGSPPSGGAPPDGGNFQGNGGTPNGGGSGGSSIMSMLPLSLPVLFILNGVGYI